MNITFADEQTRQIDPTAIVELATRVLRDERLPEQTELSIIAVSDAEIAALKAAHLGIDAPTDVLSFPVEDLVPGRPPAADPAGPPLLLGDVVIAPEFIARQAADHGVAESAELALMVVHGILHLLGWDHEDDAEAERMEARERELLGLVGMERR